MRLKSFIALLSVGAFAGLTPLESLAQGPEHSSSHEVVNYNPDANGNGNIATYDLMELLAIFGQDVEFPAVVPASNVEDLTAQVEWLSQVVELQAQRLAIVAAAMRQVQAVQSGPFVWSEAEQAWVCNGSIAVDGVVTARRLEAGSARIGGLHAN
jgi:hypothetical protein